ncbi:hypothetical protein [Chitinophaga deserti]|uniref:hypothetical protein n=1 Tax=Chitinophaga deserti TaxID=2164099 RepID=UPI000D6D9E31|nr:hypothetical protein [Chitinophaga deserti]
MRTSKRGLSTFLWFIFLMACYAFLGIGKDASNNELIYFLHYVLMGLMFVISIPIPDLILRKKQKQADCPVVRCRSAYWPENWLYRCFVVVEDGGRKRIFSKLALSKCPERQTVYYYNTFDGQYKVVDSIALFMRIVMIVLLYLVLQYGLPMWGDRIN